MNVLFSEICSLDTNFSDVFNDFNPSEDAEKLYKTLKGKHLLFIFIISLRLKVSRLKKF